MTTESDALTHLFVYGTLRPGDVRWHLLEPFVVDEGWADTAAGSVYDTGLGYPAAIFGAEPTRTATPASATAASVTAASATAATRANGAERSSTRSEVTGTIHGRTYALLAASVQRCLDVLDREEGTVGGAYQRVAITTGRSVRAWAYAYGTGLELTPIESGDWLAR